MSNILKIFADNIKSETGTSILSKISGIDVLNSKIYFYEHVDREYIELVKKTALDEDDDFIISLCGIIIFFEEFSLFYYPDDDIKKNIGTGYKDERIRNKTKEKLKVMINSNYDDDFLIALAEMYRPKDKDFSFVSHLLLRGINYKLFRTIIKYQKKINKNDLKTYLSTLNDENTSVFNNNKQMLDELKKMFQKFDIDATWIQNKIDSLISKLDVRLKSMQLHEFKFEGSIPIEIYNCCFKFDNFYLFTKRQSKNIYEFIIPKLEASIGKEYFNQTNFVDEVKNYVTGKCKLEDKLVFKIINNLIIQEFYNMDVEILIAHLKKSKINQIDKDVILPSLNAYENGVDIILCIDSLANKFEGLIRRFLKEKKIDTTYVEESVSEELTLGTNTKGIFFELIKFLKDNSFEKHINNIKYINLILNDREFPYNIRNRVSHGFLKIENYDKFIMYQLMFCLSLLIDIINDLEK